MVDEAAARGIHSQREPGDARLDALFAEARQHPPDERQLTQMLRGVPSGRSAFRRRILRITGATLSAAAVIALVWLIILPPNLPRALGLSDVVAAMKAAPVIRIVHDDGSINWDISDRAWVYISSDGVTTIMEDKRTRERADYDAHRGKHGAIILRKLDPRQDGAGDNERHESHLDRLLRDAAKAGKSFDDLWEQTIGAEDGRPVVHLIARDPDPRGVRECAVDAQSGMLLWTRTSHGRAEYSYPTEAPRDIYDLGVPRDTPVLDYRPSEALYALRDHVVAAQREPLGAYRMVKLEIGRDTESEIFITDGARCRLDRVPDDLVCDTSVEHLPQVAQSLLERDLCDWSFAQLLVDDEQTTLISHGDAGHPALRHLFPSGDSLGWTHSLAFETWGCSPGTFLSFARDGQIVYLGNNSRGEVGTRILSQATQHVRPVMRERWYDPAHAYRVVREALYSFPEADWQLRPDWQQNYVQGEYGPIVRLLPDAPAEGSETEVLQWAELRPGLWFPQLRQTRYVVQSREGDWVPSTSNGFDEGRVAFGKIIRREDSRNLEPLPSTSYLYIAAVPLDEVPEECFQMPDEWRALPVYPR